MSWGFCLCSSIHTVGVLSLNYLEFELQFTSWTALSHSDLVPWGCVVLFIICWNNSLLALNMLWHLRRKQSYIYWGTMGNILFRITCFAAYPFAYPYPLIRRLTVTVSLFFKCSLALLVFREQKFGGMEGGRVGHLYLSYLENIEASKYVNCCLYNYMSSLK